MENYQAWAEEVLEKVKEKMAWVSEKNKDIIPYTTDENGNYDDRSAEDKEWNHDDGLNWWTNGFWGGIMWLMYEGTKKQVYKDTAVIQENMLGGALKNYEKAAVRSNVWQSALPPLYLAASGAGVLFVLWFGAKNVLGTGWSAWDIGVFTTFLSCFTRLTVKSSKAAKLFNSVQKAEVSWKRIKPLMKSPEALDDLRIPQSADVTLDNLSFTYGDAPIFSGLSLTAHPGDIIGVTGPVACGKSTFGRVFLCEMPYGGSVRFGGKELSSFSPREISGMVGYLGHDPELSMDTIQNNVLCGSSQDVLPQLNAVALTDEVRAMENGADTVVGSSGIRLSGGQAQRLALARTLAHPRPLMILDDPFSALDRKTEDAVFANLQAYAKDKVIFLISHRLYHFPQMQQVIFMEDGKTTAGTHDELMASVPTYRWLYESQTGGEAHA